jgi:predicted nucleotidyltransferase
MASLDKLSSVAIEIFKQKYSEAEFVLLAGSHVREEATPYSDLDLVVIFHRLPSAYRESFFFQEYQIEVFVHDPQTLNYFIDSERSSGLCNLAQMVVEGIELPEPSLLSQQLKQLARSVTDSPAPALSEQSLRQIRYSITDLIDDLRQPRSHHEAIATGSRLYDLLANGYLRINSHWAGKGKGIPRKLRIVNPDLCERFRNSFDDLFIRGNPAKVIELAAEVLNPVGGFLFEGYKLDAPVDYRKPF